MANKYRSWTTGETVTQSLLQDYLQNQVVIACDSSVEYPPSPVRGMTVYDRGLDKLLVYTTATTGWQPPWNLPWGVVGTASTTTTQTGITGETDLVGLTLTKTLVANRRYLLKLTCAPYFASNLNTGGTVRMYLDGTVVQDIYIPFANALDSQQTMYAQASFTTTSASHTLKASMRRVGGTGTVNNYALPTAPAELILEDVGPASSPA